MVITLYLIFSMLAVLWFDVSKYIIPNWLVGSLLLLYPVAVWMSPVAIDWQMALVGMLIVFVIGYAVFAMKWMGGGDVELITAYALWVGLSNLAEFIFIFGVIGGVFSVALWVLRKGLLHTNRSGKPLPRILREGEPVPYGVAIVLGFMLMLWWGRIPAAPLFH